MARMGGQQVILSDESQRSSGRDAQTMNIAAGRAVANAIRTTLGPKGMDKMLVDSSGDVVVTNDGVTILSEMEIDHPAAKMVVDVAQTQESEVADGTTTAVVIAGELLSQANQLIEQDVHPTTIVSGYRAAAQHALEVLDDLVIEVDSNDREYLEQIAATAMTGKGAEHAREHLAELVVDAVQTVADDEDIHESEFLDIQQIVGGSVADTEIIEGVTSEMSRVHMGMPMLVEDANIAIVNTKIEPPELETKAEVDVSDPDHLEEFMEEEERQLQEQIDHLVDLGVNVVFCRRPIEKKAQHMMAEAGILACRNLDEEHAHRIARATGATRVDKLPQLEEEHVGHAGRVIERELGNHEWVFVEELDEVNALTIIVRGGTDHVVDEIERALEDSLGVVRATVRDGRVVPGGGAPEIALSLGLRDFAESVGGREQLAIEAFADTLDVIPRTLAENAGHDPIDALVELRATHDTGDTAAGLNAYTGQITNMADEGVVEPWRVKSQAVDAATEAAALLLRIDDVIAAGDLSTGEEEDPEEPPEDIPGAQPGGMGGMGGGMGGMGGGMGGMM